MLKIQRKKHASKAYLQLIYLQLQSDIIRDIWILYANLANKNKSYLQLQ